MQYLSFLMMLVPETVYCPPKFGPLPKPRLWYNLHDLKGGPDGGPNENKEPSLLSLKAKLFLRRFAVKVRRTAKNLQNELRLKLGGEFPAFGHQMKSRRSLDTC